MRRCTAGPTLQAQEGSGSAARVQSVAQVGGRAALLDEALEHRVYEPELRKVPRRRLHHRNELSVLRRKLAAQARVFRGRDVVRNAAGLDGEKERPDQGTCASSEGNTQHAPSTALPTPMMDARKRQFSDTRCWRSSACWTAVSSGLTWPRRGRQFM
ncbi:disease resistance protein RPM1 [Babesia caballi]|uniref:Disease resistance protein RPM1 n=1 Tax=Babesia caballi TaxID=5871 RepID=A0AAV4LYJ1_BABCB|nr:disease resistance protein RPM1 [Babesia caballi]